MGNLIVVKHINTFIRTDLKMSVSSEIYDSLNIKVERLLEEAKERALLDNRKTILSKDL